MQRQFEIAFTLKTLSVVRLLWEKKCSSSKDQWQISQVCVDIQSFFKPDRSQMVRVVLKVVAAMFKIRVGKEGQFVYLQMANLNEFNI